MSTTTNGYADDEGVAIIPAPPSPKGIDSVDPKHVSSSYGGIGSTVASLGSSCPSRDSVSAAIALVRAKQVAKSAILKAEEQILQPRSVSSDQTSTSTATESSTKDKAANAKEMVESENAVPVTSVNGDKSISMWKAVTDTLFSIDPRRESIQKDLDFSEASVKDTPSSHSIVQVSTSNTSLPQGPSFEQNSDEPSAIIHVPSDDIPRPPSFTSNESDDPGFDGSVDSNTIDDVNAFLSRLGVGGLQSKSNESSNSIDRLRMLSTGSSGASSDGIESSGSSIREVQPKTLAEISAIIDDVAKKHGENAEAQLRTSRPAEDHKDPPSTFALETESQKVDLPGPSHLTEDDNREENPFLPHSFSAESIEDSPPPSPSVAVQDEKKTDESNHTNVHDKESKTRFADESFAADVRKTLSTVKEAASMEVEDDDSTDEYDRAGNNSTRKQGTDNAPQASTISTVASEEQDSVYGVDGRKEPKGMYKKAKVEVEEIPLSNIGVEQAIDNNMSLMSTDSQQAGTERHTSIGRNKIYNKHKASETLETHDSTSDTDSLPWALRDVASEETMRATGRRRPQFIVSGPRPSNKSRNIVASLFDDTSQQASETASEFRSGLSFGSDDSSDDDGSSKNDEDENNDDTEVLASASVEADRCFVDTLLYNDYEPENDYNVQRGISDDVTDEPMLKDNARKNDSIDSSDCESSKVEMMSQDQSEEADDKNLKIDPSGEMLALEVGQGALSPTNISNCSAAMDDQPTVEVGQKAGVAAAKKTISDTDADVEANSKTEEEATAMTAEGESKKQSNCFLRQFEDLDLEDDCEADDAVQPDHASAPVESIVDVMSPTMLVNYFSDIGKRKFEGENEEKLVNDLQRLMMPVMNGNKPSLIEEAQIRQAALKADVPLDFVDTFIEYVKDENPEVAPQVSKDDKRDFLVNGREEIEGLDEDDAIAAFLSSKSSSQELEKGEMFTNGVKVSSAARASRKKKTSELTGAGSGDYEPSITSTIEPGISHSKESEIEPDFNRSVDSEIEPDFNRSVDSEVEPDFNRSEDETNCDVIGFKTSASNGQDESKKSKDETCVVDLIQIPKVVKTCNVDKTHPVDMEMLKACRSIESYDEGSWQRRTAMATHGWGWEEATWLSSKASPNPTNLSGAGISGVGSPKAASNFIFNKKSFPLARKKCKLSYNRRVKPHTGYFDVDMYSLQESAAFGEENLFKDETPWELRHVRQRFLHERSLTFSRNWFGDLVKTNGNDKIKVPTCKPKSMEMPMQKIPDPGDWTPEWYTTWGGRKFLRRPSIGASCESSIDSGSDSYTEKDYDENNDSLRSYSTGGSTYEDDEDWDDAPECGTFVNTKLKIGEHVTRVHPDYTSSLRRSRWRKKYFPIGTFPY